MNEASSVALVTTVWLASASRACDIATTISSRHADVLSAFLLYHLEIGVAKIFVFFDGDERSQLRVDELHPQVQAHYAAGRIELRYRNSSSTNTDDDSLYELYERHCTNLSKLKKSMESDVVARQMLNAELAMHLCLQHNCQLKRQTHGAPERQHTEPVTAAEELRWLLHLDVDELLFLDAFATADKKNARAALKAYVDNLEKHHNAHQMTLLNYEAVPTQLYGANYFATVTKFRRHHARIPFASDAQQRLAFWQQRTQHSQFFLFYDNGKSMVRVSESYNSAPASVHHWRVSPKISSGSDCIPTTSKTNFHDARRNFAPENVAVEPIGERACILHYPVCGLEWMREKYERLGDFSNVWGGSSSGDRAMQIRLCFHTQARDAVMPKTDRENCGSLRELYESHVMLDLDAHAREWQQQVTAGVCEEIDFVAQLLTKLGFEQPVAAADRKHNQRYESQGVNGCPTTSEPIPAPALSESFTTEKAWMLASISQQYL